MTGETDPLVVPGLRPEENRMLAELTLNMIEDATENDTHRRAINYAVLAGLGAEACQALYDRDPDKISSEPVLNVDSHHFYLPLLEKVIKYHRSRKAGKPIDDPATASLYQAFYKPKEVDFELNDDLMAEEVVPSQQQISSMDDYFEVVAQNIQLRRSFLYEGTPLEASERAILQPYDQGFRNASERLFHRIVMPYFKQEIHLPERLVHPELIISYCKPSYWRKRANTMPAMPDNLPHSSIGPEDPIIGWIIKEYHYWKKVAKPLTLTLEELDQQIQELQLAKA